MKKIGKRLRLVLLLLLCVLTACCTSGCVEFLLLYSLGIEETAQTETAQTEWAQEEQTEEPEESPLIQEEEGSRSICSMLSSNGTPATGQVRIPVFLVEFSDVCFSEDSLSAQEVETLLFDEDYSGSMAEFESCASYGALELDGDVYVYRAKYDMEEYETGEDDYPTYETLAMEVLEGLDDQIDYSQYDSDGDGYLDAFVLNIAGGDQEEYWYGCQTYWGDNPDFEVDGIRPFNFIINDAQPDSDEWSREYYVQVMCHEFGHCLGLPDYYYAELNTEETAEEADGFKGEAGLEMMDDMEGDYCQFSRLMLGYLEEDKVEVYRGQVQTFRLESAQEGGGCLLLPRDPTLQGESLLTGEYFVVEYNTRTGAVPGTGEETEGLRVFHADAELAAYDSQCRAFLYDNTMEGTMDGRRVLRLVRDGEGYFTDEEVLDDSVSGFAWYDSDGKETVSPGFVLYFEIEEDGKSALCTVIQTES